MPEICRDGEDHTCCGGSLDVTPRTGQACRKDLACHNSVFHNFSVRRLPAIRNLVEGAGEARTSRRDPEFDDWLIHAGAAGPSRSRSFRSGFGSRCPDQPSARATLGSRPASPSTSGIDPARAGRPSAGGGASARYVVAGASAGAWR